jgi:hypothetical protein
MFAGGTANLQLEFIEKWADFDIRSWRLRGGGKSCFVYRLGKRCCLPRMGLFVKSDEMKRKREPPEQINKRQKYLNLSK